MLIFTFLELSTLDMLHDEYPSIFAVNKYRINATSLLLILSDSIRYLVLISRKAPLLNEWREILKRILPDTIFQFSKQMINHNLAIIMNNKTFQ